MLVILGILSTFLGCTRVNHNDTITSFSLSKGGGMRPFTGYSYLVEDTEDGRVHFLFDEGYPNEKEFTIDDHAVFDSLQQIVLKHKMNKYSGHYKPLLKVLDGHSWDLDVKYVSGATISANGYEAGPKGYREAFDDVIRCLDQWKNNIPAEINGVVAFDYVYGTTRFHVEPQGDHTLVTIDDDSVGRHEQLEKPLDMMEDLRVTSITEHLRENGNSHYDDPEKIPFRIALSYSNGDHYLYEMQNKCHKTEVVQWFFNRWEIEISK